MDLRKLKCPKCGGRLFGLTEENKKEKKVFNTDDMEIPLLAPTWIVEDIWQEDPYFPVECYAGHKLVLFTESNRIIDVGDFNKEMDKEEAVRELVDLEYLIGRAEEETRRLKARAEDLLALSESRRLG